MLRKIKSYIHEDKRYFSACKKNIEKRNHEMLIKGSIVYAFVLCFYTIFTIVTKQPQILQTMYYVFDIIHFCLCMAIFICKRLQIRNNITTQILCICLEISILGFFLLEGVFTTKTQHSLYIPIAIFLVLLLFIHEAAYAYTITTLYVVTFSVMSFLYKTPEAYINDFYIAVATLISANIGYIMIAQMRHSEGSVLAKYERLSQTDQLTGLLNKISIQKVCEQLLTDDERTCSFLFLDLDDFKRINDQYGHDIGDEVLKAVSREMKTTFRNIDYIGRFGGDEFIILMDNCKDIKIVKERVEELIRCIENLTFSKTKLKVHCSVGITTKHNNDTTQSFFKRADTALYQAKKDNKGYYRIIE